MNALAAPWSRLHDGLERMARSSPDAAAVLDRETTVTYRELDERAGRIASLLLETGVQRGDRVAIYLDKSHHSLSAIYGILKAGAVYVPLDPQAPPSRLGFVAGDCGVRHLLTGAEKAEAWPELAAAGAPLEHLVVLNADGADRRGDAPGRVWTSEDVEARDPIEASASTIGHDLAFILYTSGSTGVPKGVSLTHVNALSFVAWAASEFGVGPEDRLSSHAPLHFDLSTFDVFAASLTGASVVLVPPETSYFPIEVARFIETRQITVWYSVPSILNMLVQRGGLDVGAFPSLRTLLFAGEVFPTRYLRSLMRLLPHVRFVNLYGPTETNVCTWYDVPPIPDEQTEPIPIGRAIPGVEVFAVDDGGRRVDTGTAGELFVRGPTVMRGYWGDPERTARSLVATSSSGHPPDLAYRTGDLAIQDASGDFRLLGRRDHQIKSRGYRIELGDIESVLYAHPSVLECAVLAIPDELVTNRLRAYVVVRDGTDRKTLSAYCRTRLPKHMIPEAFEFHEGLPKTSTGKIDRQRLTASVDAS